MFRHLIVLSSVVRVFSIQSASTTTAAMSLQSLDFEVYGRVQGVFFRKLLKREVGSEPVLLVSSQACLDIWNFAREIELLEYNLIKGAGVDPATLHPNGVFCYTKEQAQKLGLRGWCMNTAQGTVLGHVQGPSEKINSMMQWLRSTGSPSSKIDKAEFRNQKEINDYSFDGFDIRKD